MRACVGFEAANSRKLCERWSFGSKATSRLAHVSLHLSEHKITAAICSANESRMVGKNKSKHTRKVHSWPSAVAEETSDDLDRLY